LYLIIHIALLVVALRSDGIIEFKDDLRFGERAQGNDLRTVTILDLQGLVVTLECGLDSGRVLVNLNRDLLTIGIGGGSNENKKMRETSGITYPEDVTKSVPVYVESDNIVLTNRSFGSRHWALGSTLRNSGKRRGWFL
jgi:hypothetical protein